MTVQIDHILEECAHHHSLLKKQTLTVCVTVLIVMQFVRVWYMLWTVIPGEPGLPGDPTDGHTYVRMEGHRKIICTYILSVLQYIVYYTEMVEECS